MDSSSSSNTDNNQQSQTEDNPPTLVSDKESSSNDVNATSNPNLVPIESTNDTTSTTLSLQNSNNDSTVNDPTTFDDHPNLEVSSSSSSSSSSVDHVTELQTQVIQQQQQQKQQQNEKKKNGDEFQDNPNNHDKNEMTTTTTTTTNTTTTNIKTTNSSTHNKNATVLVVEKTTPTPSLLDKVIQEESQESSSLSLTQQQQQQQQSTPPSSSSSSTSNTTATTSVMDNETKVATQMAAVAALAGHKNGYSPSVAASYAKDLMSSTIQTSSSTSGSASAGAGGKNVPPPPPPPPAPSVGPTIAKVPPPPPPKPNSSSSSSSPSLSVPTTNYTGTKVMNMKKKRQHHLQRAIIPVQVQLVQKYLQLKEEEEKEEQQQQQQKEHQQEGAEKNDEKKNGKSSIDDQQQQPNYNSDDGNDSTKQNDDIISQKHAKEEEEASPSNETKEEDDKENEQDNDDDNDDDEKDEQNNEDEMIQSPFQILLQQMQTGENTHFLKQLLVLSHHTCIENDNNDITTNTTTASNNKDSKQNQQPQDNESKDETLSNNPIQMENEKKAKYAALKVIELLGDMNTSFDSLYSLLPSVDDDDNDHGEEDEIIHDQEKGANENNDDENDDTMGLEDFNPTMSFQKDEDINCKNEHDNDASTGDNKSSSASVESHDYQIGLEDDDEIPKQQRRIIPDLLPPCTSKDGDATTIFFKACASVVETPSNSSSSPTKNSAAGGGNNSTKNSTTGSKRSNDAKFLSKSAHSSSSSPRSLTPARPASRATTMISSVFTSVKSSQLGKTLNMRPRMNKVKGLGGTNNTAIGASGISGGDNDDDHSTTTEQTSTTSDSHNSGNHNNNDQDENGNDEGSSSTGIGTDYNVVIEREMLGLTVENVLERTIVRTTLPNGAAKKAGTKVGSLIVKVGTVETANLTHFETIDELRQSKRPLRLILRKISKESVKSAREEMGRLIKGGAFGHSTVDVSNSGSSKSGHSHDKDPTKKTYNLSNDIFLCKLQERWVEGARLNSTSTTFTKKEETLAKAGAKLVWLLCLLILGMEREAQIISNKHKLNEGDNDAEPYVSPDYSAEDYLESAKSVSKVLHDYVQSHFARGTKSTPKENPQGMNKKRSKQNPPTHIQDRQRNAVPGASRRNPQQNGANNPPTSHTLLLKIGDVLHRTRSFFADPFSPPAALLRGEIIALLCDILDLDTEMALSDEEAASSTAGRSGGGPINDLGSAGSLLKLIVLNCPVMRSVGCVDTAESCHSEHAGNRFMAVVHRLAASRSTSARVTACSLGPVLWSHLDFPHQLQLRGVITRALHDLDVIVRKSIATVLHEIAELVFDSRAVPWLVLMCERAMTDPEPQLRSAAMTLTWHLAEHLPNAFFGDAKQGSRSRQRLPPRTDPAFVEVYLLQCKLLPVATRLAEDGGASVRLAVAAQCDRLANAMGEHWYSVIIDLLQALLSDKDDKVRAEASLCIPRLAEIVLLDSGSNSGSNVSVLESLLPGAMKLLKDASVEVRVALASAAGELLTLLVGLQSFEEISVFDNNASPAKQKDRSSYKKYIDDLLIPLLQNLLKDSNPEVTSSALRAITNTSRGNVREISNRRNEDDSISLSSSHQSYLIEKKDPVFIPVLSEEQVLRLMPTLSNLASSNQWRVRQSAVEIVPALLGCTHKLETRTEIAQLCVTLMSDGVDAVRKTAAECLCLGGNSVGDRHINSQEWVKTVVMPHLVACRDSTLSKQRLLGLKMVEIILNNGLCHNGSKIRTQSISSSTSGETDQQSTLVRKNLEIVSSLSHDETVNVRLNVGRVLCNVMGTLDDNDIEFVITILDEQITKETARPFGGDRDVHFFAMKAKRLAKELLNNVN